MLEEAIFIGLSGDVQLPFQPQKYIFGHNNMIHTETMERKPPGGTRQISFITFLYRYVDVVLFDHL